MTEQSSDLENLEYEKAKDGVVVTGYNGDPETVVIPDTIDGAPVVRIKVGAFARRANLRSITLPQGLTEIQDFAFCDSFNLRFVTLPSGITIIGAEAFASKTTLVAPADSSAQKTAEQAGYETYEKVSVYKDSGMELCWVERNGQAVVAGAFGDGKTLVVPDEIAGVRVTKIRDWAFEGCASLTAITLPHSLEEIGACAFYRCTSLTSVTLLQEKTILGFWVFKDCPRLTSVSTPQGIVEI